MHGLKVIIKMSVPPELIHRFNQFLIKSQQSVFVFFFFFCRLDKLFENLKHITLEKNKMGEISLLISGNY